MTKVTLQAMPVVVVEAALSTESSTMKELEWIFIQPVSTFIHVLHGILFDVCTIRNLTCTP